MGVTTKDIAEACGVSTGTVDRALNNRPGINEVTKKEVLKVAEKMGYRPNFLARSLVKGKTKTLGLVFFDLHNRFFAQLVDAIEIKARKLGYFTYLTLTETIPDIEIQCINHLVDRKIDGLIICPVNMGKEYENFLNGLKIPVVSVANKISSDFSYLGINDRQAMKDVVKYIINKKYDEIIYVSPPLLYKGTTNIYSPEQRFLGYQDVLKENNYIKSNVIATKEILSTLDKIDFYKGSKKAILCTSDVYALKILNYLKEKGLKVPNDVGLMGFDNIDILDYVEPSLSTVSYPIKKMGEQAVEHLISRIEKEEKTQNILLKHEIIPGNSM